MIDILGKPWGELTPNDIWDFLSSGVEESFFFEFKDDRVRNEQICKEISAFANTYGGYLFVGVGDNLDILGCSAWTEERISQTIFTGVTPVPSFDVRSFSRGSTKILVVRVSESIEPPCIVTKTGAIYERLSSTSAPVQNAERLTNFYNKRIRREKFLEKTIEHEPLPSFEDSPANLCGSIELGFAPVLKTALVLKREIILPQIEDLSKRFKGRLNPFNAATVGPSLLFSFGQPTQSVGFHAGLHNYMEVMPGGIAKVRIVLFSKSINDFRVNVTPVIPLLECFQEIYKTIVQEEFRDNFIFADKYHKLAVVRQFTPFYGNSDWVEIIPNYRKTHEEAFGNLSIISGQRVPRAGYFKITKEDVRRDFGDDVFKALFNSVFEVLGYIEPPKFSE